MSIAIARAVMVLAISCFGERHREWARAMDREFAEACEAGEPLRFALGCLIAAGRGLPMAAEGRFRLLSHALALGAIVPLAVLQLGQGNDALWQSGMDRLLWPEQMPNPLMVGAIAAAVPSMLALRAMLGIGHLRLAWALLERDWTAVLKIGALMASATVTLLCVSTMLLINDASALVPAGSLILELLAVYICAQWHARLSMPERQDHAG